MTGDPGATRSRTVSGPLSIAVTGGIGAGKSTVSRLLADRGAVVIDADRLAREVVEPGTPGLAEVVGEFGDAVLADDGSLDRPALGAIVFGDEQARKRLESITHPLVRQLFAERMAAAADEAIVVNDIPLIRTIPDAARYHLVIAVGMADSEARVRRLVGRGHTEQDARARIAAQISDDQRLALCDVWIDNSADLVALESAVARVWDRLTAFAANRRAARCADADGDGGVMGAGRQGTDVATLLSARVARAADGAGLAGVQVGPRAQLDAADGNDDGNDSGSDSGPAALGLQVTVGDAGSALELRDALIPAGFPERVDGVHGNADPGKTLSLYLKVR